MLTRLHHIGIIKVYKAIKHNIYCGFIMEKLTGGSLNEVLRQKNEYWESEAKEFMRQILEAVKFCHNNGICHADLKPANIVLANSQNDTIKIVDFGEAFEIQSFRGLRGTPAFQAPEILNDILYGSPIDIWACGVIMFYLLTGVLPFVKDFTSTLKEIILDHDPTLLFDENEGVSKEAMKLTKKLLNKDPNERITAEKALADEWFRVITANDLQRALNNFKLVVEDDEEEIEEDDEEEDEEDFSY
ncbi:hypothetical protein HA402_001448 [Bradysia odoriphaga]|nr:hypothetical protein HA402_001448 [Bradysia odoriphaga]